MRNFKLTTALLVALPALGAMAGEKVPAPSTAAEHGLAVGEKAPPFALVDQRGETVELAKLLQNGPVAVVFSRSLSW